MVCANPPWISATLNLLLSVFHFVCVMF
jgi:hypothetical protein